MSAIEFRKILCPTDFSRASEFGIMCGLDLASRLGGEMHIVHAFEQPGMSGSKIRQHKRRDAELKMSEFVDTRLPELRTTTDAQKVLVTTEVVPGGPVDVVDHMVKERAFDMVVVARLGRTALSRFATGSFSEELLTRCSCPVLVVRHIVAA